jgi:hypothetical protein
MVSSRARLLTTNRSQRNFTIAPSTHPPPSTINRSKPYHRLPVSGGRDLPCFNHTRDYGARARLLSSGTSHRTGIHA